nr:MULTISPECIES: SUMF1/EgtB/PvdO family nonheme iron enzyme [unclassified Treponema]
MTHLHKKRAAALITAATLTLVLLFTGCPNSAGGSGGGTTPPPENKTYAVDGVNFTMKGIAAVTNGTVGHTDNAGNNAPHTVSLLAYRIGETEVTQELWEKVMGTNPSYFQGSSNPPESGEVQEKRPVENVNWYQCIAFCNKLSKLCNLDPCYTVTGINFDALNFSDIPTSNNTNWNNAV